MSKRVLQYHTDGEFIREWESLTSIREELGLNISSISSCAKGKIKSAHGYKWKYLQVLD